ncbi:hypothetical protein [Kribbella monticola]|uniref:hypothetical protein n=1 Tax=Kribbella monticola TaxID=2185285 RepID=UPI001300722D|nr:hypothetical protein [Kribbella monticola]
MTRRPLQAAATLSALLMLAACTGSPKAGQPNTTPPPTTPTITPSPTPSTPTWTPEQQAAITAAKSRYTTARAAVDKAFEDPAHLNRTALEKVGNGGEWIITVIDDARFQTQNGWYQTGQVKISGTQVVSVKLGIEQPEVQLTNCIDSSAVVTRFTKTKKPVPMGPGNGDRHKFSSRLVYAQPNSGGPKMWFLVAEKGGGPC